MATYNGIIKKRNGSEWDNFLPVTLAENVLVDSESNILDKIKKNQYYFYPEDYGCVGNGVTDDVIGMQNCINACNSKGGVILLNKVYAVSTTLLVTGQVSFLGLGSCSGNIDNETPFEFGGTGFKYIGSASVPVIVQSGSVSGCSWENFGIDGNDVATIGIKFDRICHSTFSNISTIKTKETGIYCKPISSVANDNFMFNTFMNVNMSLTPVGLVLDGNGNNNCCHNHFDRVSSNYTHIGFDLYDCDNNVFTLAWGYDRTGLGASAGNYTLVLNNGATRSNTFFHWQGTVFAKANSKTAIYHYDRDNGQNQPVIEDGAILFYSQTGNNAEHWNLTSPMKNLTQNLSGAFDASTGKVCDSSAFIIRRTGSGQRLVTTINETSRYVDVYYNKDGSGTKKVFEFIDTGFKNLPINGRRIFYQERPMATSNDGTFMSGDIVFYTNPQDHGCVGSVCTVAGSPGTWTDFGAFVIPEA